MERNSIWFPKRVKESNINELQIVVQVNFMNSSLGQNLEDTKHKIPQPCTSTEGEHIPSSEDLT